MKKSALSSCMVIDNIWISAMYDLFPILTPHLSPPYDHRLPGETWSSQWDRGQEEVLANPVSGGVLSQPQHRPPGPEGRESAAGWPHEHQNCRYLQTNSFIMIHYVTEKVLKYMLRPFTWRSEVVMRESCGLKYARNFVRKSGHEFKVLCYILSKVIQRALLMTYSFNSEKEPLKIKERKGNRPPRGDLRWSWRSVV